MSGNLDIKEPASEGTPVRPEDSRGSRLQRCREPWAPRVVHRDGMAYVEGCDIPVWRLEMARRTGSPPAALLRSLPA